MIFAEIEILIENNKYEDAIALLKRTCVGPLIIFKTQVINYASELHQYRQDELNLVANDLDIKKLRLNILKFAKEIDNHAITIEPNRLAELFASTLLLEDSFAFIDRISFRNKIGKSFASDKADVILVDGKPKSGMSYLSKFLSNTARNVDILNFIPIEIPAILGDPDIILGEKLAKNILNELGLEIEFDLEENEQFKFKQFVNKLKAELKNEQKVTIFFLHDFHKIEDNNDNLLSFIFTLITSLKNDFPKCIFIIAGLNYQNIRQWHSDLKFTTTVCKLEQINVADIKNCLDTIFLKYESEIKIIPGFNNITKDQYIEGMTQKLVQDINVIDIASIGLGISEHLLALKQ